MTVKPMFLRNLLCPLSKKGSILIVSLWIVAILSAFAVSLTQRARANLRAACYQENKLKAYHLAKKGVTKAIAVLTDDIREREGLSWQEELETSKGYDTLDACGVDLEGRDIQDIFSSPDEDDEQEGSWVVGYYNSAGEFVYGLRDEESRVSINIDTDPLNNKNEFEKQKIIALLEVRGVADAEELADAIKEWVTSDPEIIETRDLAVPEKLLLPLQYFYQEKRGYLRREAYSEAQKTYLKIADLITVYSQGLININTVSDEAFKIVCLAVIRLSSSTNVQSSSEADINRLWSAMHSFIGGGRYFNGGQIISGGKSQDLGLETAGREAEIINGLINRGFLTAVSSVFRIESTGTFNRVSKKITAVYNRLSKRVVYWHES